MSERKLTNWMSAFMEYTKNTEPASLFREWTAVAVVAAALRRKCRLEWGMLTFYPNMYIVLVGPSGSRKGTAMDPGYDILCEIPDIRVAAEATTREALIRALKEANYNEVDINTGAMEMHSSLTIWSQELTVFMGYHNRQLMADMCDWYDCRRRWKYETKHQGTDDIIGVWVNVHAATTPDLIQSSIPLDAIGGGLTSRMMLVYEPGKGKVSPYPEKTADMLALEQQLILDLSHINQMRGPFRYTEGFFDLWHEWYPAQDGNPPFNDDKFSGYFERRPTHVMKLSMIQAASRKDCIKSGEMVIDKGDLENAINLLERTEHKMPTVFSGVGKSNISDLMPKMIRDLALCKTMSLHEMIFRFHRDADEAMIERAVRTLEKMRILDVDHRIQEGTTILTYKGREDYACHFADSRHLMSQVTEGEKE